MVSSETCEPKKRNRCSIMLSYSYTTSSYNYIITLSSSSTSILFFLSRQNYDIDSARVILLYGLSSTELRIIIILKFGFYFLQSDNVELRNSYFHHPIEDN